MRILPTLLMIGALAATPAMGQDRRAPKRIAPLAAGKALERWENMTPEERRRALDRLTPERRAQVERRMNRLELLPPETRAQLRERYREFEVLPQDRQDALRLEIQALRGMRPALRRMRVNSPEFGRQYSADEQKILRQVLGLE